MGWLTTQEFVILVPDPIVFAPWSVLLDRGEPCVTAVKTRHALWCCVSLAPRPTTSPPEGRFRRDNEVLDPPGVGVGGQPEEQRRGTRDQPRHHQAAARRRWRAQERRALWFSQYSSSLSCQSVFLLCDFIRSAVQTDALVVSLLLVPWSVYCCLLRCKQAI